MERGGSLTRCRFGGIVIVNISGCFKVFALNITLILKYTCTWMALKNDFNSYLSIYVG